MKYMMIVKIPESTEFSGMPAELQKAISRCGIEWPQAMMVGTMPVDGHKLILVNSAVDKPTLQEWINGDYPVTEANPITGLGAQYIQFGLGWEILAVEGETVSQAAILPYMADDVLLDEQGEVVGSSPVTDLTNRLQVWTGKKWEY